LFIMALALAGCSAAITRNALPADQVAHANPLGIPGLRAWGDVIEPKALVTCPPEMLPIFGRVCFSRGRTNETQQV
jgi:hypothetical protein